MIDRLTLLIDHILGVLPGAHLFVAQIIDRPANTLFTERIADFDVAIPGPVRARTQAGFKVHVVNMFPVLSKAEGDFSDNTYPSVQGSVMDMTVDVILRRA